MPTMNRETAEKVDILLTQLDELAHDLEELNSSESIVDLRSVVRAILANRGKARH